MGRNLRTLVIGRWLSVLALLVSSLAVLAIASSAAFAAPPAADTLGEVAALPGPSGSGAIPIRQADPDLTAVKTNNVAGSAVAGVPWIWTIVIANGGTATATFAAGQIVLADNLPNGGAVNYGVPQVAVLVGSPSGPLTCEIDFTVRLTCIANGGAVTIPAGSAYQVAFTAVSSTFGAVTNPRAGLPCAVDPNNNVAEGAAEGNNACADTVTVRGSDLTATKTNNVGGAADVGGSFTWTITIGNTGQAAASFTAGQMVLVDNLPNGGSVSYGTATVTPLNGASGPLACTVDFTTRLACVANAGTVTVPPGGTFQVALPATALAAGAFANPRAGLPCAVDPNNLIPETNEANNACSDLVRAGPDLTATKTNNVNGAVSVGASWVWTILVENSGATTATFAANQIVLVDNLPNAVVTYGTPTITPIGSASGPLTCEIDFTTRLTCTANAGAVTIPAGSGYRITVTATTSAPGVFANPRAGLPCAVDPNSSVVESNEGNNSCSDVVRAGPDLTATKTNNVNGSAVVGATWTWGITVANPGTSAATFTATQAVLFDHLPNGGVTYGTPTVTPAGGASGPLVCAVDFSVRLACFATGGTVTVPPGGSFQVSLTATSTTPGSFANPRAGSSCAVDPNGVVVESSESNNACSDTVVVAYAAGQGGPPGQSGQPVAAAGESDDDDDEDEDDRRLTETQRRQRERTNASGQDDERTEGNVLEVRCDASSPPVYEVAFPTHVPYLVIGTGDGDQQLRLLYGTRDACQSVRVGDYVEADGDKEHEQLFNAHELTIRRRR